MESVLGLTLAGGADHLRRVFAASPMGIVFIAEDRRIFELNAAAAELIGLAVEEVIGRQLDDFLHPDEIDETLAFEGQLRSGAALGQPRLKRFLHRDGSIVHVRVTVTVLDGDDGAPQQVVGFLEDVTAICAALDCVQDEQARLALTLEASGMATWDLDLLTGEYAVSENLYEVCGIERREAALTFAEFIDRVHPDDLPRFLGPADPANADDDFVIDFRLQLDDGHRWFQSRGKITSDGERPVFLRGAIVDITETRANEAQQRQRGHLYRRTIDVTSDAFVSADLDGRIVGWNPAAECMFGWSRSQVIGERHLDDLFDAGAELDALIGGAGRTTLTARHREGETFSVEASVIAQSGDDEDLCLRAFIRDISHRVDLEHEHTHRDLVDDLTHLPNQTLLLDRLRGALARRVRDDSSLGVFFIDIEGFKLVNDSLGQAVGDELLVRIADRMSGQLRSPDTLARLGGHEFVVLSEDLEGGGDAVDVAERLLSSFEEPITAGGRVHHVAARIGIRVVDSGEPSGADVLRDADAAMHRAKSSVSDFEIFDESVRAAVLARLELDADLHRGVDEDQFVVAYQPVVAVADERIIGMEALVRWNHPTRGLLGPDEFIAAAEANGLIQAIGLKVLARACRQLTDWHRAGRTDLCMAVNLSGAQLTQADLPDQVAAILDANGLAPGFLALEITESLLMSESDGVAGHALTRLHDLGVTVAADDFGTGYSSLLYLRRFPVDTLKLDQTFVAGIDTNDTDRAIVGSTIDLAHSLNMLAIGEGVERQEQLHALRDLGCDFAQGFYWSKPLLPGPELTALFEDRRPD